MNEKQIKKILSEVQTGNIEIDEALKLLNDRGYEDLGYAKIDHHRQERTGYPEVIFGEGKTPEHVAGIIQHMQERENNILATRVSPEMFEYVHKIVPEAEYNPLARTIAIQKITDVHTESHIAIVTAGTSDLPVAEEAAVTAEIFGNQVKKYFDVGVAGIHRFYDKVKEVRQAKVVVCVAGMEGALPSIVGGQIDKPVIAVPTSVGYGANFGGLAALLGMLTSCASGVSVVNIDNGFGAGYLASMINKL